MNSGVASYAVDAQLLNKSACALTDLQAFRLTIKGLLFLHQVILHFIADWVYLPTFHQHGSVDHVFGSFRRPG